MKKKIILIAVAALVLLSLFLAAFLTVTNGRTYVSEGITQNDRLCAENIRYENGSIYYTLVNKTRRDVWVSGCVILEKEENGRWVNVETAGNNCGAKLLSAFSVLEGSYTFRNTECLAGRYRLSFGPERYWQDENGTVYAAFDQSETYLVGHLEITKEQAPSKLAAHTYFENGVRKHKQVDFTASLVGGVRPKLLLSLTNHSETPLTLDLSCLSISRHEDASFRSCGYQIAEKEVITVDPGETFSKEYTLYKDYRCTQCIDPPETGRYCVSIPYDLEEVSDMVGPPIPTVSVFFADHKFNHFD